MRGAARQIRDWLAPGPRDHRTIFSRIHRRNLWGDGESVSGPGSTEARAATFRDELMTTLRDLGIGILLDAPCGDFNWAAPLADAVDRYLGIDVVPEIIAANAARHAAPGRVFLVGDITRDRLPPADAILCRDALVHFALADVWAALDGFHRTGARYLMTTTFDDRHDNPDIRTGSWRPLNLQAPPFGFPPPLCAIDERCTGYGGRYRDKRLSLWPLAALPRGRRPR